MIFTFLDFLQEAISYTYISVYNSSQKTVYLFDLYIDGHKDLIELTSEYSHSSLNNIYIKYSLLVNNMPVLTATRNLIDTKEEKKHLQENPVAKRLEILIKACSAKLVQQEINSQKNHMLKGIYNDFTH